MSLLLLLPLLAGCPPVADADPRWTTTCGDPACSGYGGPFDGVPLCTTEVEGEVCADEGFACDPEDSCNALLLCTVDDPKDQTGGCPVSRAAFKRDIHYLSAEEAAAVAARAGAVRLATWSYRWEPPGTPAHLGFVIDDDPGSPAVTADGDHVDLYGYTSLTLAAAQVQARRVDAQADTLRALEARLSAQEAEIAALRLEIAALRPTSDRGAR